MLLEQYQDTPDDELPMCTDEDRWYTGTKYAVYKKVGDARAAYVADTEKDAHNYITNKYIYIFIYIYVSQVGKEKAQTQNVKLI